MKKYLFSVFIASLLAPTSAFAYGEGSTIPYESRVIHLLTNEVRTDVHTAIDACGKNCHEGKHCTKDRIKHSIGMITSTKLQRSMPPC